MKAALDARGDPSLVVMGRTGTRGGGPSAASRAIALRAPAPMKRPESMRCFFTGLKNPCGRA